MAMRLMLSSAGVSPYSDVVVPGRRAATLCVLG
jgi:hypothetical protein